LKNNDLPHGGLQALEARVRHDLVCLGLPAKPWVPPLQRDHQTVHDVVVVGAGMAGLALAASLTHLGIRPYVIDRAPAGFEGPWATTARMETLRSPKELTGPALGIPSLTFRAWYEAQFGAEGWTRLDKIPRLQWADYLRWYRQVLGLVVHNQQQLIDVSPRADGVVALQVANQQMGHPQTLLARHVVLATGRDGLGGPWVPPWSAAIPRDRWLHSGETWSGERLCNLRVAVIGAGASAMDAAATALEHGAHRVDLLIRRHQMPRINKSKGSGNPGMAHGYWALPDEWKWRIRHYINQEQVPPPRGSTLRVSRHHNAYFHFGAGVQSADMQADGSVVLHTAKGPLVADFVIFCTGFRSNWSLRPEFSTIAPHVRVWQDRFATPAGEDDAELAESPDLGPLFEFQPKVPGLCPGLERIYCFNYAGALSQGAGAGDIPQISDGAQRLARGLATRLLSEDIDQHFVALQHYDDPELLGDEWQEAEFPRQDGLKNTR
jgi:cation diffusion facilitator CzcD-associated flavoprotein CzcO